MPAQDRLTPEEDVAQLAMFQGQPDLQRRLGLGEWCGLQLGQPVTPNFNPATHVAPRPLEIVPGAETWMAWDSSPGAHCHCTIIAQHVGRELRILAALVSEDTGLQQHIDDAVMPWVLRRAPWLRTQAARLNLFHRMDPNMYPHEGGDRTFSGEGRVRVAFGGGFTNAKGPADWASRINPLLELLNRGNSRGGMALQIDPGEDCRLLCRALGGEAYYREGRHRDRRRASEDESPLGRLDRQRVLSRGRGGGGPRAGSCRRAGPAGYAGPGVREDRAHARAPPPGPRKAAGSLSDWP